MSAPHFLRQIFILSALLSVLNTSVQAEPGDLAINFNYDAANSFDQGVAAVINIQQGRPHISLINKQGEELFGPAQNTEIHDFREGLAPLMQGIKWGFINTRGEVVIAPRFDKVLHFNNGLAAVLQDGKWGYINKTGKWQIRPRFERAYRFNEESCSVQHNGLWGFVDKQGKWLIKPRFQDALIFDEGLAPVKTDKGWGYINK